jgi:transposase
MIYWRADWGDLVMARQKIELAAEEAEALSRRARATTVSARDRRRAEIIVLSAQGLTQQRIAEQLGISRVAVNRWVGRFALHRLDGLTDRAGRGRKPWLPQAAVQQVVEQAVTSPPHLGRWSCRTMARAAGISPASVQRLWAASDIKPHLSRAPSNCRTTSALKRSSGMSSGCISTRRTRRWCCAATRNHNARRWSARNRVCRSALATFAPRPTITCDMAR